jgi:hypothetical protein
LIKQYWKKIEKLKERDRRVAAIGRTGGAPRGTVSVGPSASQDDDRPVERMQASKPAPVEGLGQDGEEAQYSHQQPLHEDVQDEAYEGRLGSRGASGSREGAADLETSPKVSSLQDRGAYAECKP